MFVEGQGWAHPLDALWLAEARGYTMRVVKMGHGAYWYRVGAGEVWGPYHTADAACEAASAAVRRMPVLR